MNSDSDSDLKAYINQLCKKAQDLQEHELDSTSTPTNISISEYEDKNLNKGKQDFDLGKQTAKDDKIKHFEEKYLKKAIKQATSSSLSESEFDIKETACDSCNDRSLDSDADIYNGKLSELQEVATSNHKPLNEISKSNQREDEVHLQDDQSSVDGNLNFKDGSDNLASEEHKDIFHASARSKLRRKSSETSLLLNKSGNFYLSSLSSDAKDMNNFANISLYHSNSATSSENDSIYSEVPESISEEIPEVESKKKLKAKVESSAALVRQESLLYSVKEISEYSQESDDENENTLQGTKSEKTEGEDDTENASDGSEDDEERSSQGNKNETPSQKEDEYTTLISEASSTSADKEKASELWEEEANENESGTSTSQVTKSPDIEVDRKDPKTRKSRNTKISETKNKKRHKNKTKQPSLMSPSSSPTSSSPTSSSSSSSSSSFYVKIKNKKYKQKKRKLKSEKQMSEFIIKTLVKNLPLLLRYSVGQTSRDYEPQREPPPRQYLCSNCGSIAASWKATDRRVDDVLRQTVDLTRQFLDTHRTFVEIQTLYQNSDFKYTKLKNYAL